ncbi:aminotransferase class V-fold PLP-dependent enzyme [uncultured Dokdonia sp.]|uniref:pyridoxal phosphate-dependent decarboxylase family protein n=1 Tax=uncultured Dokdonia sp. TaxID=575653 RepID=UPI00261800F5|nr:aminotransferase class V-fold PLP-dependent enzyme [uncultured Dokdonia sp.]
MSTALLHKAYKGDLFKEEGNDLIALLADHLTKTKEGTPSKVTRWVPPQVEYDFWQEYIKEKHSTKEFFSTLLERSIHTHHPKYIGHQIASAVPVSALATFFSAQLNNGMTVYEMGQASTAIEKNVIDMFLKAIGYAQGDGFLTSGGTLANLTAMLAARKTIANDDIWNDGHNHKLAIMVSEEAHYCVDRAARIMGLGSEGIIKIPVNEDYAIRTEVLETYYDKALANGRQVIAIVGSAPSTSTGVYDNLQKISAFAKAKKIWFHVDGAHGGAAIFSSKYKHLLKGIDQADSVIIDGHKMMGTSSITTAVLFKNDVDSYTTFEQKAQYLWDKNDDPEWYNLGKRTFECTKSMMSLRFFAIMNAYGTQFFDDNVTVLYDAGREFGTYIEAHPDFALALTPISNIVCFRYIGNLHPEAYEEVNRKIRQTLLEDGEFYIVSTLLKGEFFLRTTFMNPFTNKEHMELLLEKIKEIAVKIEQTTINI